MVMIIKSKATDISFRSVIDKGIDKRLYREWIRENNLADTVALDYADWVSLHTGIERVEANLSFETDEEQPTNAQ